MATRRVALALVSMLVLVIVGACSGADEGGSADTGRVNDGGGDTAELRAEANELPAAPEEESGEAFASDSAALGAPASSGGSSGGGAGRSATGSLPDIGPSVIKTAMVEVEVERGSFRDSVRDGVATAERYGGFVVTTSVEDEERGVGSIVLRVPASRFGDALTDLEELGEVKSERVSGQDVGQEFVDLQARLRNFTAQEAVLLRLMARAQSVVDTIRVQGELQGVQLEIERLRGRIRYLEDQTSLGTIEVRISEAGAAREATGELGRAWERAKDGFIAVIAGVIASLGVLVPSAILIALIVFIVARLRPRWSH